MEIKRTRQSGMVLLEVIAAMTIIAIAGISVVTWARQIADAVTHARAAAIEVRTAGDYLDRIALWPREDLDRHFGAHRSGNWTIRVSRPASALYTVAVADSFDTHILVSTVLYRPDTTRAEQ